MTTPLHQQRKARLVEAMREAGCDLLIVAGNAWRSDYLRYVSDAPVIEGGAFALVDRDGAVELVVETPGEAERVAAACPALSVDWAPEPAAEIASRLDRLGNRRAAVAPQRLLPVRLQRALRDRPLEDATELLDRLIRRKGTLEMEAVRRASRLADDGYEIFRQACRAGRAEYEVIADVEAWFRAQGCPDNFMIMGSGGVEVRGMHPPGDRRLQAGDLVTTELTPCIDGYYAQICRTLVMGEPSAEQHAAFALFLEALEAGLAAVRAGVTAAAVAKAENEVFRRHGYGDYVTSEYTRVRGHGLGLYVDGAPPLLEDVETVLEPDMTIIVHPNTYHPVVGYIVLGDMVRVTEDGYELLCATPRALFSAPV